MTARDWATGLPAGLAESSGVLHREVNTYDLILQLSQCTIFGAAVPKESKTKSGPSRTTPSKTAPERYLTYRLDVLSTGAIKMANDVYEAQCGLTVRELRILRLVDDHPGITFSDLTEETRFERSLASRLLNRLLDDRLVERVNSAADARVFHLQTTAAGKERRRLAARIGGKLEAHLLRPLSEQQRAQLLELIEHLTEWVYGDAVRELDPELVAPTTSR